MPVFRELSDFSLDEHSPVPKYEQLKRILLTYISGMPQGQEYLPYEEQMGALFSISRRTVRRALEELRQLGVIETTKKSGSRVLKRKLTPEVDGAPCNKIPGSTVGIITVSDRDDTERSGHFRGQVVVELERLLMPQSCSLVVYNLRKSHWQAWQDYDKLTASMLDKGIKWALVYVHGESVKVELLHKLLRAGIKPVAVIQDFASMNELAPQWAPGIDYVAINHCSSIVRALDGHFADADSIIYVTNQSDSRWSKARAAACRGFAAAKNIPFECLFSPAPENVPSVEVDVDTVQEMLRLCAGKARPVCFAANDMTAESLMEKLHVLETGVLDELQLVGYDNEIEQRSLNISTFDFDASALANAVLDLYRVFLRDQDLSMHTSHGIMTYSKFINRTSL